MYYVYVLLDPRRPGNFRFGKWKFDYEPFYVGKGTKDRAICHWRSFINHLDNPSYVHRKHNPLKDKRFQHLYKAGVEPIVVIKKRNLTEEESCLIETALIETIGRVRYGGPLLNLAAGGKGGGSMLGRKHSAESIEKNRESNKQTSARIDPQIVKKRTAARLATMAAKSDAEKLIISNQNKNAAQTFWDGPSEKVEARNAKVRAYARNRYATMSESDLAKLRAKQAVGHITKHLPDRTKEKIKAELKAYIDRSSITSVDKLCKMVRNRFYRMVS